MSEKRCTCLRDRDQTGVPVTLNWQGDNTHGTKMGGILSMLASVLVVFFIIGSLYSYLNYSQFSDQVLVDYVDVPANFDCSSETN